MALRATRVAPTVLTQVGHEGNPTQTAVLTVSGTLDGTPSLKVAPVKISDATRDSIAAPV